MELTHDLIFSNWVWEHIFLFEIRTLKFFKNWVFCFLTFITLLQPSVGYVFVCNFLVPWFYNVSMLILKSCLNPDSNFIYRTVLCYELSKSKSGKVTKNRIDFLFRKGILLFRFPGEMKSLPIDSVFFSIVQGDCMKIQS